MKHQDAPGTTFKRHLAIARGLLGEDDYLLTEILLNPHTPHQLDLIIEHLSELRRLIKLRDDAGLLRFINSVRGNIE